nr:VWA domain-containing protein [Caldichromatium japonicum]
MYALSDAQLYERLLQEFQAGCGRRLPRGS